MLEKVRKLPVYQRMLLNLVLTAIWIIIALSFNIDLKSNLVLSSLIIAGISTLLFWSEKPQESVENDDEEQLG